MSGCKVLGVLTILDYEIPSAKALFKKAGVPLVAMAHFSNVAKEAIAQGQLTEPEYEEIKKWHSNPAAYKK